MLNFSGLGREGFGREGVVKIERKNWISDYSCPTWACKSVIAYIRSILMEESNNKKKHDPRVPRT